MDYIDKVLIKLQRRYSKDETVAALTKKLKEVEFENGKLIAEIDRLSYKLKENNNNNEIIKVAKIEARKEELYLLKLKENKRLRKENINLKMYRGELLNELRILKTNKL